MAYKSALLVVDQDKVFVDLMIRVLSSGELSVTGTTSITEAATLVEVQKPRLVLVDLALEGAAKAIGRQRGIRTIALASSDEMKEQHKHSGMDRIVVRDRGLDVLMTVIRQSLDDSLSPRQTVVGRPVRVLLVDDEIEIQSLVSDFLQERGYNTTVAANGRQALECLSMDPDTDLILMDVSMPEMGGIEALSLIVARDHYPPVIMISALRDREIARQALAMGAFDYVVKPFAITTLEESIVACLNHSHYHLQPWWPRLSKKAAI
jgi:CheY-like chemotaxis protein